DIEGANSVMLKFLATAAANGEEFEAVFTNTAGKAVTHAATLIVDFAPQVTTQPANQTVATGSQVTLKAAAAGTPAATVQWQVSTDGGTTFKNLAGARTNTLRFIATTANNKNQYRAVFTNPVLTATTSVATLTVT